MVNPLAIFDLDSTILEGDCERLWANFLLQEGIVDNSFTERIDDYARDYELGQIDYIGFETFLLQPLASIPGEQLYKIHETFMQQIARRIRPVMLARLEKHRADGYTLILLTASNSFLVEPIAKMLGIPNLFCTIAEMQDGHPTGKIVGTPAYNSQKVILIKNWLNDRHASLAESWGYSDSHNDLPFLKMVEHPVAVTPDAILRRYARQNGWEIIEKTA